MSSRSDNKGQTPPNPPGSPLSRAVEVVEADPETSWSMWDSAQAELDSSYSRIAIHGLEDVPLPALTEWPSISTDGDEALPEARSLDDELETRPQPIQYEVRPIAERREAALAIVEKFHKRVASTIRTMWGYPECGLYINKLIMNGGDGMGNNRIGFNQDAANAMMELGNLHDEEFGSDHSPSARFGGL